MIICWEQITKVTQKHTLKYKAHCMGYSHTNGDNSKLAIQMGERKKIRLCMLKNLILSKSANILGKLVSKIRYMYQHSML